MARKKAAEKREILPDPKFNDVVIARFVNTLLVYGEKSIAENALYRALDMVGEKSGEEGIKVFKKALENIKPSLEVKSRRIGGANYQVPVEVKPERRRSLASRWLIEAARARSEHSITERLAGEIMDAAQGRGNAMKKKEDTHRMAEANKAFAHFRW